MKKINRRQFIRNSILLNILGFVPRLISAKTRLNITPSEIAGPFYPLIAQKDKDFDLTRIEGHQNSAIGQVIYITGRIKDSLGNPIEDALIDIWQANAAGRYRSRKDSNGAKLDPDFQGWAMILSGKNGAFKFKTILPGAYPAQPGWLRPPHIHFIVSKSRYHKLTTQMYFEDQELNQVDLLLKQKTTGQQKLMIAKKSLSKNNEYYYDIILQRK